MKPAKLKIFTVQPFAENVWWPLFYSIPSYKCATIRVSILLLVDIGVISWFGAILNSAMRTILMSLVHMNPDCCWVNTPG